ncbi:hypothetical protein LZ554_008161 [Drepanopeziza brunnea f. sp. 'monogermtubi']|nr:hypothetical protein LZ554_008161 [Drepanopeziza brunnea f. sp. 'monogermtubi']
MATDIRALRFYGREDIKLESVQAAPCGSDEVRVKIAYCGICGTDIHEYLGGPIFPPQPGQKNAHSGAELPVTLGHEMSGTIIEVGSGVTSDLLHVGQRICVNPSMDDRHHGRAACSACRSGRPNICAYWTCYGLSARGGGLAGEIVVKAFSCLGLPTGVSLQVGALVEPLAVASHMLRIAGFAAGQDVVVLGAGPVGLALLLLLRARGARKVVVSEVAATRSLQAERFGADVVVNPLLAAAADADADAEEKKTDAVLEAVAREMGDDGGADIAFDATGLQSTLDTALAVVKPGGVVFNVAIHEKPLLVNPNAFTFKEARLMGGICYTREDFEDVLRGLAAGELPDAGDLITSVVPLEDVVEGAFLELIHNKTRHVKILVRPSEDPDLA